MAEAKPTASLSSGLLARKGAARPAMRRQGLGGHLAGAHDDLGWNDMGHEPDADEHESHVAHVAEIMPLLSPMGGKFAAARVETEVGELVDAPDEREAAEDSNPTARSPLSVKPGKPPVVLQREALEDRVRTPAAAAPADTDDASSADDDAVSAEAPQAEVARQSLPPTPVRTSRKAAAKRSKTRSSERRTTRAQGAKAAFTLRIDSDRHLRLRLASAVTNLSAQQILTEAFDEYLKTIPEVETLAGNVARRHTDRS